MYRFLAKTGSSVCMLARSFCPRALSARSSLHSLLDLLPDRDSRSAPRPLCALLSVLGAFTARRFARVCVQEATVRSPPLAGPSLANHSCALNEGLSRSDLRACTVVS